jgi:hypothetical protein
MPSTIMSMRTGLSRAAVRVGLCAALCLAALPAGSQQPPPPAGQPDWASMPTVSPTGKPDDPMLRYYNGTVIGEYHPLWVYQLLYNRDGSFVLFYGHHYPDGSTHMGASERFWRVVGTPGHYAMCLKATKDPKEKESCAPFDIRNYGDVWYQDYDRSASGDIPTYNNVHEVFSFVEGRL